MRRRRIRTSVPSDRKRSPSMGQVEHRAGGDSAGFAARIKRARQAGTPCDSAATAEPLSGERSATSERRASRGRRRGKTMGMCRTGAQGWALHSHAGAAGAQSLPDPVQQ